MPDEIIPQTTLRETLEANVEAAETGTLPTLEETRARDEVGRFAKKPEVAAEVAQADPPVVNPLRPTTWKKEYLPLWDKAAAGQPLAPDEWKKLAEYNGQRENEYKTGVSTYRAEAQQAKEIQESIAPFLSEMQFRGVTPAKWIKDVGQAHYVLVKGTPEQKLGMFQALARQYGVPLAAVQQQPGQVHPMVTQMMQANDALRAEIAEIRGQVQGVSGWKEQLDTQALASEIQKMQGDTQTYPHFEAVREPMAQILEKGMAPDLPTAYKMATRMDDGLWDEEVNRRLAAANPRNAVAQARAKAISPRTSTPSGEVASAKATDRRSVLSEAFDAQAGGRV
jgi:hypothetical protein